MSAARVVEALLERVHEAFSLYALSRLSPSLRERGARGQPTP
jgi:hypothetical protein